MEGKSFVSLPRLWECYRGGMSGYSGNPDDARDSLFVMRWLSLVFRLL